MIQWFRRLLALHQLVYLSAFLPNPASWFASGQMVVAEWTYPQVFSLFYLSKSPWFANGIFGLIVVGWILLGLGKLPKLGQVVLLILQISLHNANPLIIHEPQQLANFFLLVSILWPPSNEDASALVMSRMMIAFLCSYYVFAGAKKLPDLLWIRGGALQILLQWQPIAKHNFITGSFLNHPSFLKLATWFTLIFELGFSFVAWSRWRKFLIPIGFAFHLLIGLTFEVGTFSLIMAPWYVFLWKDEARA